MKRLCVLLALLLLAGCAYDPSQPPSLMVSCSGTSVRAWQGGCNWRSEKDGQTVIDIADGMDPVAAAEKLPRVTASVSPASSVRGNTVALVFDLQPDRISVEAHSMDSAGSGSPVASTVQGFDLLEGDYVYILDAFWEDHGTVRYAFRGSYTVPLINTLDQQLERLKKQYPQYVGLPVDQGLYVFVWKLSPFGYGCGLGTSAEYSWEGTCFGHDLSVVLEYDGLSFEQMHILLSDYDVPRENIHLVPFQHPLSSYYWRTDEATQTELELAFWGWKMGEQSFPVAETCVFDVDGDGKREVCALGMGFTSGVFSFHFVVREIGSDEDLVTAFVCPPYELSFVTKDGTTMLRGVADGQTHLFDIQLIDGRVSLTENGRPIGEVQD